MKDLDHWYQICPELQQRIGYSFKKESILMEAMTHSSFANEWKHRRMRDNERLEFLGDSVLGLIISHYIFETYHHLPEGELTKVRANVVCEASLALKARRINIGSYLLLGRGEEASGGRDRESILADGLESLIAAIYLDGGFEIARAFVLNNFHDLIDLAANGDLMTDYKTKLQEIWQGGQQGSTQERIEYCVVDEQGPDHNKTFFIEVRVGNQTLGAGQGKNKKEAEQRAAKSAINFLEMKS
ncbi:ribonuclease III [Anoxynatronum buryatiense]|uniref:Ribonuclease 3 n=1 Tax=Anoxynatronum buryatiense TaxID=489973 RepID=A0AA45WUA3_9CLOT|nr:ribonuclease III [Anoxynatronum buryatiense]SMP47035.1 RNAse III [Anoxynatronum buryatiense]